MRRFFYYWKNQHYLNDLFKRLVNIFGTIILLLVSIKIIINIMKFINQKASQILYKINDFR